MARLRQHIRGLAFLEHAPGMQYGHGPADFCDHAEVMRHEQDCRAMALPEPLSVSEPTLTTVAPA